MATKDQKKDVKIIHEKTTEFLKYEFSPDEVKEMSIDMAQKTITAKNLEEQKKAVDSDFKSQIDAAKLEANSLARKIRDGHEYRNIDCKKEINFETGMTKIIRMDTGEQVTERKMNASEKQMTITGYADSINGDQEQP